MVYPWEVIWFEKKKAVHKMQVRQIVLGRTDEKYKYFMQISKITNSIWRKVNYQRDKKSLKFHVIL